jgi:hypothetical protein
VVTSNRNIERINDLCAELVRIIDDSRATCNNDDDELIFCIAYDSVLKVRRAIEQQRLGAPVATDAADTTASNPGSGPAN